MKRIRLNRSLIALGLGCLGFGMATAVRADYYDAVTNLNPVAYYRLNDTGPVPAPDLATNLGSLGGTAYYYAPAASPQPIHPATSLLACTSDTAATFAAAN